MRIDEGAGGGEAAGRLGPGGLDVGSMAIWKINVLLFLCYDLCLPGLSLKQFLPFSVAGNSCAASRRTFESGVFSERPVLVCSCARTLLSSIRIRRRKVLNATATIGSRSFAIVSIRRARLVEDSRPVAL